MTPALIKVLGTAHGLFALWSLLILPGIIRGGVLNHLSPVQQTIKLTASFLGVGMLFLCMWFSWKLEAISFVFAWLALGMFIVAAFSDTVALRGPSGLSQLMPTFYKAIAIRAVAAFTLMFLVLSLPAGG